MLLHVCRLILLQVASVHDGVPKHVFGPNLHPPYNRIGTAEVLLERLEGSLREPVFGTASATLFKTTEVCKHRVNMVYPRCGTSAILL